jgi:hypothetical protein
MIILRHKRIATTERSAKITDKKVGDEMFKLNERLRFGGMFFVNTSLVK